MNDRDRLIWSLVRLRELAGLTRRQVAQGLECSPETVARMERGENQNAPNPRTVRYLLDIYDASESDRAELLALARKLHQRRAAR